jgi:hypothetical protein
VSRRVSLPAADDLFRPSRHTRELRERGPSSRETSTGYGRPEVQPAVQQAVQPVAQPATESVEGPGQTNGQTNGQISRRTTPPRVQPVAETRKESAADTAARRSSGRVRHDEKMTVYVTADELLDIEHARLSLRRDQGLAVDRGRLVREAIAIVLADLEVNGDDSVLVQRLLGT